MPRPARRANRGWSLVDFNSGKVTQNTINALLPGPGTYYLVCNNRFGLLAPKAVEINAILHYVN